MTDKGDKKTQDYLDACLNPVRQRIIQAVLVEGEATTSKIRSILSDVPRASLYRHIKKLSDAGIIRVVREEQNRGMAEKTYACPMSKYNGENPQDMQLVVQSILLSLVNDFGQYLKKPDPDPVKDMLSVSMSTLMLSDEELTELMTKIGEAVSAVIGNEPKEGRKPRKIVFVSAPVDNDTV